ITAHPQSISRDVGQNATFTVTASGSVPLSYQWPFNDVDLSDGGQFSGVHTASLTVTSVALGNEGNYSCVVSNSAGSAESNPAALTFSYIPVTQGGSIQSAINAASHGTVIEVSPGTYAAISALGAKTSPCSPPIRATR